VKSTGFGILGGKGKGQRGEVSFENGIYEKGCEMWRSFSIGS
jgi:hypothetical protein